REATVSHLQGLFPESLSIFEAASPVEAQGIIRYKDFELILLDVNFPGACGTDILPELRQSNADSTIIVMSGSQDALLAERAIKQGANAFISKSTGSREMNNAIQLAISGETYISPSVFSAADNGVDHAALETTNHLNKLTPRQQQVLNLLTKGFSNKAIANKLSCTEGTAKLHVSAILERLEVSNRTEAVMKASMLNG
ncbi:MAG: LuxR C-terminal-related transcriptional regulator, partial [Leucothrix sp.]